MRSGLHGRIGTEAFGRYGRSLCNAEKIRSALSPYFRWVIFTGKRYERYVSRYDLACLKHQPEMLPTCPFIPPERGRKPPKLGWFVNGKAPQQPQPTHQRDC
jgi:hypothetical protein